MRVISDYWKPIFIPFRVLRIDENTDDGVKERWRQWGGSYDSLHHAAGYMRTHLPALQRKRIVLVMERYPDHRLGLPNYRLVTLWEGKRIPEWFGTGPNVWSPDDIKVEE